MKFQTSFHNYLTDYINGSLFSHADILLSFFFPQMVFSRHAHFIIKQFRHFIKEISKERRGDRKITIEPYLGNNIYVLNMMTFLDKHLKDDLLGAYVHGSLGTYEEIPYSDFDSLVILKSEVFDTPERLSRVAINLKRGLSIMFDFDPFQHHGWFVLTAADLQDYPEHYFPSELFRYAKSLFSDKGLNLNICNQNSLPMYFEKFDNFSTNIIHRLSKGKYPRDSYELKGILSQFMLLPSLYVEVRDKRSIYKKYSFEEAKKDFSVEDWSIMDEISLIRKSWTINMSSLRKRIMTSSCLIWRYIATQWSPSIPDRFKKKLTDDFYQRMVNLIILMKKNLMADKSSFENSPG